MRLIVAAAVAALVIAVAMFLADPVAGPPAIEFVRNNGPLIAVTQFLSKFGVGFSTYGLVILAVLALLVILFINATVRRTKAAESEKSRLKAELQNAKRGSEVDLATLPLDERIDRLERESSALSRELSRLEDEDEDVEEWRDRLDDVLGRLKITQSQHETHGMNAAVTNVISEIQRVLDETGAQTRHIAEATGVDHVKPLEEATDKVDAELAALELRAEPLARTLARAKALEARLSDHVGSETGMLSQLRELERTRERLQTRMRFLKPSDRDTPDIGARITTLAAEVGKLETELDKLDPDTLRSRLSGLDKRLEGFRAQLTAPTPMRQAAE